MIARQAQRQLESFGIWPLPEGWSVANVHELASIGTGDKDTQDRVEGGMYPFFVRSQTVERINSFSFDGVAVLTAGDGVGAGKVFHFVNGRFDFHQRVYIVHDFSNELHAKFFFEYFKEFFIRQVSRYNAKTSVDSVRREMIAKMVVPLPSVPEQERIAAVLLAWNRAIEFTERKILAKRRGAKGLMQRLVDRNWSVWTPMKLGELFKNRKRKGIPGLPTYSVTMNAGLVPRDSLDRKNDTTLEPEQHLVIEEGDIAYNMMRMWQGASGLATEAGLVSPAYVVIRSRGKVDPAFASYWFKMPRVVKKFQDYSHGLTKDRLRLYYKDFATIALPLPPLKLQKQIAEAMQCCDRELAVLERKVTLLKQQKKGLMQQLLTGKTRVKLPKGAA